MKGLSIFQKVIYVLNIPFGFLLLFSYLANFVNPSFLTFFGLLGLSYPILLAINLFFVLFWLISLKRQLFFSLACILIGFMQLSHLFQANGQHRNLAGENHLKVMSYNVRAFNYRLWEGWQESSEGIKKTIEAENADILCVQEYLKHKGMPQFNYRYKHIALSEKNFGLAIYSNHKIIDKGAVDFEVEGSGYNQFIYADILLKNKDTVRIVNAHLQSIGLDKTNLSKLKDTDISQEELEEQKTKLIRPLLDAYKIRGNQARTLSKFIENSSHPVIFCGDLNDPPGSYVYRSLAKQLKDTFIESGSGFSTTVPMFAKYHLPLRIDYIFCDELFTSYNYTVVPKTNSDHYPITVDLLY